MSMHPELRNKSIAVAGDVENRHGIILTANYNAKHKGVKTGMAIWQAQQMCRDIVLVPAHMDLYLQISKYTRDIFNDYTDQVEPFGIDEAWLDVGGSRLMAGTALKIAKEINQRTKDELGITCSIGVSYNKIFAKLGSDYKKPDGITVISRENYKDIVWPLPASDLLYVGSATKKKLDRYAIHTIGDLAQENPEFIHGILGKMGYILHDFANGLDRSPVSPTGAAVPVKSVGNSMTTHRDLITDEDVWIVTYMLAESVAARMRALGVKGKLAGFSVRDCDLAGYGTQTQLPAPTNLELEIAQAAFGLYKRSYKSEKGIRSIGVRMAELQPEWEPQQLLLGVDEEKRQELLRLENNIDGIRRRFGYFSLQRAVMYKDRVLSNCDAQHEHTIHPHGYF